MVIVKTFYSRERIISFSTIIFRVDRITEDNANTIEVLHRSAFSHYTGNVRLRDILAFKTDHDLFFGFERSSRFNGHSVAVNIKTKYFYRCIE